LLGSNDLKLVRIGIQAKVLRYAADLFVRLLDQFKRPFGLLRQGARMRGRLVIWFILAAS
jgi:hypothetical protein